MTDSVLKKLQPLLMTSKAVTVAIDGRCASGKSTLASALCERLGCNVIHMDDFYLRPEQRTAQRLSEPGGNIDYERFEAEVLNPLMSGADFSYRPYDCHTQSFGEPIEIIGGKITVVEGSYSCHPRFRDFWDLHVFIDISNELQLERIKKRNGSEALERFVSMWIPMEERYFSEYKIKETCELCL